MISQKKQEMFMNYQYLNSTSVSKYTFLEVNNHLTYRKMYIGPWQIAKDKLKF